MLQHRLQQVLPAFVAVGIAVGFAAVGGRQEVPRGVVGEGIGRGAVAGPGELAESIVGIGPGFPAGGFPGDIARGVVGKLAGQPVGPAEADGIPGNTGGGAGCSGGVGVRSARFAVDARQAAQSVVGIVQRIPRAGGHGRQKSVGDGVFRRVVGVAPGVGLAAHGPGLGGSLAGSIIALGGTEQLDAVLRDGAVRQPVQPVVEVLDFPPVAVRHAAQAAVRIVGVGPAPALGVGPGGHTAAAVVPEGHPCPVAVSFIKSIKIQLDRRNPA